MEEYIPFEVKTPTSTNDVVQNKFEFETHFKTLRIFDELELLNVPSTLHSLRIEDYHYLESLQDVLMNRNTTLFELYIID